MSVLFLLLSLQIQRQHADTDVCARYSWLAHPVTPLIECEVSIFEFCKAASIGELFDEYLQIKGFLRDGSMEHQASNTKIKIAIPKDQSSMLCYGLVVRRHLLSLMNTQNVQKSGVAIDLLAVLEKTELHKVLHHHSFWPKSYHMGLTKQRRQFFEALPCDGLLEHPLLLKNNEHKGKGIIFLDDPNVIRKLFLKSDDFKYGVQHNKPALFHGCDPSKAVRKFSLREIESFGFVRKEIDQFAHTVKGTTFIAQRYINDALLVNGHKFGVRVFIVILSLNPFIVLFSDGYISINAELFDADDINKQNVLSNREMSENAPATTIDGEWNWSFERFAHYLSTREDIAFDFEHVRDELVHAANLTFLGIVRENGKYSKSTRKKLKKYLPLAFAKKIIDGEKDNNYMWLAIDFLVTTAGSVKLLEINLHPGTRYIDHCSFHDTTSQTYDDWQCQQGRNVTSEIVDVALEMAHKKKTSTRFTKRRLEQLIHFHHILLFYEF